MKPNQDASPNLDELRPLQPLGAATSSSADGADATTFADVCDSVQDLFQSVDVLLKRGHGFLARHAEERPEALLACAMGLGFILGGGAAARAGGVLARAARRMIVAQLLHRMIVAVEPIRTPAS